MVSSNFSISVSLVIFVLPVGATSVGHSFKSFPAALLASLPFAAASSFLLLRKGRSVACLDAGAWVEVCLRERGAGLVFFDTQGIYTSALPFVTTKDLRI